ncbi:TonB-dependent receptor [Mucilaginibacter mali]|uniref:TonB-dependent receptor n=1 Tax=Mucilaginibacter mali TaxID=2740462 RepID=A0A7D4TL95_9SPHI|nr:outer membrane beta-barrel protein [Mucilaginibacter mali]QKJ29313.1 TonB-dependent receptor [Mucilaginibacter mali]
MKLLFGCLTASVFLLLYTNAKAQNKFSDVQGQVVLQDNSMALAAAVSIIRERDSVLINTSVVAADGFFKFHNIPAGTYIISVNYSGYQTRSSAAFVVGNSTPVTVPTIKLIKSIALKEVVITNKTAYIENRPDKIVLNIEKGGLSSGISVLDVLGSAPGVRVGHDGEVFLKGVQKAGIAINGRMVKLSPADLAEQLQNLPIGSISQVELIANPSAKYEATGAGGLINIILKKGQGDGFNGSVSPSVGRGNFNRFGSGINLNYRSGKLNFFGGMNFNDYNTDHTILTHRYVGAITKFDVDYYNSQKTYSGSYNAGADYNIDATHTLGLLIVGSFNNSFLHKNTASSISNNSIPDSTLTTASILNKRINNITYNLNYNGKLGYSDQILSADADYSIYNRTSAEDLNSIIYYANTGFTSPPSYYINYAPTRITNVSGRVDYVNPVSKKLRLEAGLKSVYTNSDNSQQFDKLIDGVHYQNDILSSQFKYTENITAAYINYIATPSKKFDYQIDLRVEHTHSDANTIDEKHQVVRNYTDYFPVLMLNYHASADHLLSFNFNRRIDRPVYQELNPIIAFQDRYDLTSGNAYLKPAYQDKIEFAHTYKGKYTSSLYATFTRDFNNFTYFAQNDATGIFMVGKMNLKTAHVYGITFDAPVELNNWWNININVDASYQHYTDYAGKLDQGTTDAIFKLNQQFILPGDVMINLAAQYEVPTFYAIYHYRASYYATPSISKKLFGKQATLSFTLKDAFNTERDRYSTEYANLSMMGYDKKETRIGSLSFTWRFGKSTVKASRKHSVGNSDDMKRVTGVN